MIRKNEKPEQADAAELRIRPHHGLCLQFYEGKGYSDEFTAHMTYVKNMLENGCRAVVVQGADDICSVCPNRRGSGCVSDDKVNLYDNRVMEACGLKAGKEIGWEEFAALVQQNIILTGKKKRICPDCQWSRICQRREDDITAPQKKYFR